MNNKEKEKRPDAIYLNRLLLMIQSSKEKYIQENIFDARAKETRKHIESFHESIHALIQKELEENVALAKDGKIESQFLATIYSTIDKNISNTNLKISDLCKAVHLERTQVYRKLRSDIGMSPTQLIRMKRMQRATILLAQKDLTIGEVASKCGYLELSYFDKVFLNHFGRTPSAYRKMYPK